MSAHNEDLSDAVFAQIWEDAQESTKTALKYEIMCAFEGKPAFQKAKDGSCVRQQDLHPEIALDPDEEIERKLRFLWSSAGPSLTGHLYGAAEYLGIELNFNDLKW